MRKKNCAFCKKEFDVLYRVQYKVQRTGSFYVKTAYWKSKKTILCIAMGGLGKNSA